MATKAQTETCSQIQCSGEAVIWTHFKSYDYCSIGANTTVIIVV